MTATLRVHGDDGGGIRVITPHPGGAPAEPGVDAAVLDVAGGHLTWSVLALDAPPVAVLDDPVAAQSWAWALYGEAAALALAAPSPATVEVRAAPVLGELLVAARRLAFAHWAARWWPASTVDAIPPLDEDLLHREIAELTEECELVTGGEEPETLPFAVRPSVASAGSTAADGYALAAGGTPAGGGGAAGALTLARGSAGSDWRRYPPGLFDASERAVAWEARRVAGRTVVTVNAAAAPPPLARHLAPRALVTVGGGAGGAVAAGEARLRLVDDAWVGETTLAAAPTAGQALDVRLYLPAFADPPPPGVDPGLDPDDDPARQRALRDRLRALARDRLDHALAARPEATPHPLRAEIAAAVAASDTDF
ncbi:hypothetical protein ACTWP5_28510 [Streptomyces sp. 4N509B]|uniref:hypothetical protein n=1 Tax=Streptomyces sp. 4N509B TaxID=3457413 RepID=UPI003FD43E0F